MKNVTKVENAGASLKCEAYGEPRPRMVWVKVDSDLTFSEGDTSGVSLDFLKCPVKFYKH